VAQIFAPSLPSENIQTKAPLMYEFLFYGLLAFKELGRRNESVQVSVGDDVVNQSSGFGHSSPLEQYESR
jgi:hypothetical protein